MKATNKLDRRSFLKISAATGGGLVLGFSWTSCSGPEEIKKLPENWHNVNGYLKIADDGTVTIMSPNPEIGQNVKTSMPMIVAEELDCNWEDVIVEQAPLDTEKFNRQVAGGSQSIRQSWISLRTAGATARAAHRIRPPHGAGKPPAPRGSPPPPRRRIPARRSPVP